MTKESLVGWLALIGRFTRPNAVIINVGERFNFVRNQMVENEYEMYRCKVVSQNFLSIFLVFFILSNDSLFFQVEKERLKRSMFRYLSLLYDRNIRILSLSELHTIE